MIRRIFIEVISLLFILLFVYAAASKVLEYEKFSIQIGQSPLLTGFGNSIPGLVIGTELVVAVMLVVPRARLVAFFGAFFLMVMFTAYIYAVLHYSPYVPCSCGGVLEKLDWTEHLVFNTVFVVLALTGIFLNGRRGTQFQKE